MELQLDPTASRITIQPPGKSDSKKSKSLAQVGVRPHLTTGARAWTLQSGLWQMGVVPPGREWDPQRTRQPCELYVIFENIWAHTARVGVEQRRFPCDLDLERKIKPAVAIKIKPDASCCYPLLFTYSSVALVFLVDILDFVRGQSLFRKKKKLEQFKVCIVAHRFLFSVHQEKFAWDKK